MNSNEGPSETKYSISVPSVKRIRREKRRRAVK